MLTNPKRERGRMAVTVVSRGRLTEQLVDGFQLRFVANERVALADASGW
ncbi:MAG: hypothetical protein U0929_02220 [Planctomycetaceae bacterium]